MGRTVPVIVGEILHHLVYITPGGLHYIGDPANSSGFLPSTTVVVEIKLIGMKMERQETQGPSAKGQNQAGPNDQRHVR